MKTIILEIDDEVFVEANRYAAEREKSLEHELLEYIDDIANYNFTCRSALYKDYPVRKERVNCFRGKVIRGEAG